MNETSFQHPCNKFLFLDLVFLDTEGDERRLGSQGKLGTETIGKICG